MLKNVYNQIIRNKGSSINRVFVSKNIEGNNLDSFTLVLIKNLIQSVSETFFASNFLKTSMEKNLPSFKLNSGEHSLCFIHTSVMVNNSTNILIGSVHGVSFIIAQHVTSCDFIYFPKYNYIHIIAHSSIEAASNIVNLLTELIDENVYIRGTGKYKALLKGIILSHGRPYHFFYDTAAMAHKLYEEKLLNGVPHFQMRNSNFIDFTELYGLQVSNHIVKFDDVNKICKDGGNIFFKVGLGFKKKEQEIVRLIENFDSYLVKPKSKLLSSNTLFDQVSRLKEVGYFILWFGISTDKRSLENQTEILSLLVVELEKYHKVCVVVDGWTFADNSTSNNHKLIESDLNVLQQLQTLAVDTKFVSLIGTESSKKIAIAQLVDFHVSSAGTGSLWPSRIARKKGVLHTSNAFREVSDKGHVHHNSTYMPECIITDISNDNAKIDFISYKIDVDKAIDFIKLNYPILFTRNFNYKPLFIARIDNTQAIDLDTNLYKSISTKPKFWLDTMPLRDTESPYKLTIIGFITFHKSTEGNISKIYIDFGEGLSEKHKVFVDISKNSGSFEVSIEVDRPLHGLRFDIINAEVDFNFNGIFYNTEKINSIKE